MNIRVNDEPRTIGQNCTVAGLLAELGFAGRKGFAVAVNDAVVARAAWPAHALADGDRILLIQATQGG